jgi:formylglycine-generating enzyme required for sulfatase activity
MRTIQLVATLLLMQANPAFQGSGSVSGRILSLTGEPALNVRVSVAQVPDSPAQPTGTALMSITLTDNEGRYRLENIPAGLYYIAVGRIETPTYFPGVAAIANATPVNVRTGENLTGFDLQMVVPPPLKISGRVNSTTASPVRNLVRLMGPRPLATQTLTDGTFEFRDLRPGDYELSVQQLGPGGASLPTPVRITLVDRDITGLELGIPPALVSIAVDVEQSGPQPRFQILFIDNGTATQNPTSARTSSYTIAPGVPINLLPGTYRVTLLGLPDGFFTKSIRIGATDLLAGGFFTAASKDSLRLVVSLGVSSPPPWVKVRGKVTGSGGAKAPVTAIEISGQSLTGPLTATVLADGSFEFPTVPAGTYRARPSPSAGYFPRTVVVGRSDVTDMEISPPTTKDLAGDFIKIQPGEFMMGCSAGDTECLPEERPSHKVRITKGFEIGRYEVTQRQWEALTGSNPSQFKGEDLPVENVNTWTMVEQYIEKLNGLNDGYRYRIPTEAEWEYAARAGSTGPSFAPLDTVAWHGANSLTLASFSPLSSSFATFVPTHPGGQLQANAWGLYDMQGNVWEWTADWYSDRYYDVSPAEDPTGPPAGPLRVMKGGSALVAPTITRVSMRGNQAPIDPSYIFGVRLVRDEIR